MRRALPTLNRGFINCGSRIVDCGLNSATAQVGSELLSAECGRLEIRNPQSAIRNVRCEQPVNRIAPKLFTGPRGE